MHHGELLGKFIHETGKNITEFGKEHEGISRATINRDTPKETLKFKKLLLYAHALNIHVDSFEEGKMICLSKGLAEVISTSLIENKDYNEYLKVYFRTIEKEIKNVQSSITIVDYMKNNFQSANDYLLSDYSETYHMLYTEYLKQIEEVILTAKSRSQRIKYNRFYQTPVREIRGDVFGGDKLLCGIDMIYTGTIRHFIKLWDEGIDAKMYLFKDAIRPTSYMLLDDKVILSEYIKYDQDGFSRPDILFVDRKQSANDTTSIPARLIRTYQYEMSAKNLPPESRTRLTPKIMVDNLKKILWCYESTVKGTDLTAENQDTIEFYKGRIDRTKEKIELLKPFIN